MKEILVVGGGASGTCAALAAAEAAPQARVTLLEGLPRVGKKILVTGNGRCNLTNAQIAPAHYHSDQPERLAELLAQMPTERTLSFFRTLGLYCAEEEQGRVYPYSRQSSTVLDVLLTALRQRKVNTVCGCRISGVAKVGHGFSVTTEAGEVLRGDALILSAGGKAAPKHGSDGSGHALAALFGHRCTPLYPCLTALSCASPLLKGLKGVRAHGQAALLLQGRTVAVEQGELQFTDYGLSGIPVFQLSCYLRPGAKNAVLALDLLPDWTEDALLQWMRQQRTAQAAETLETFLPGLLHKKLLYAAMKAAAISPLSRSVASLQEGELRRLCRLLKNWRFPVTGTPGWDAAQVTGGGIPLTEINDDFSSRLCPGLYLTGELLDAVGDCGGYNLHWAWCSGLIAGAAAGRSI